MRCAACCRGPPCAARAERPRIGFSVGPVRRAAGKLPPPRGVAQWLARLLWEQEIAGSSPVAPTAGMWAARPVRGRCRGSTAGRDWPGRGRGSGLVLMCGRTRTIPEVGPWRSSRDSGCRRGWSARSRGRAELWHSWSSPPFSVRRHVAGRDPGHPRQLVRLHLRPSFAPSPRRGRYRDTSVVPRPAVRDRRTPGTPACAQPLTAPAVRPRMKNRCSSNPPSRLGSSLAHICGISVLTSPTCGYSRTCSSSSGCRRGARRCARG